MSEHAPGCRIVTSYPRGAGGFGIVEQRCVPECPVRRRAFSPQANVQAALRYMRDRYRPRAGWPRG